MMRGCTAAHDDYYFRIGVSAAPGTHGHSPAARISGSGHGDRIRQARSAAWDAIIPAVLVQERLLPYGVATA